MGVAHFLQFSLFSSPARLFRKALLRVDIPPCEQWLDTEITGSHIYWLLIVKACLTAREPVTIINFPILPIPCTVFRFVKHWVSLHFSLHFISSLQFILTVQQTLMNNLNKNWYSILLIIAFTFRWSRSWVYWANTWTVQNRWRMPWSLPLVSRKVLLFPWRNLYQAHNAQQG